MATALDAHHSLLRKLIQKYKCYEVKTIGDSFMVACADPIPQARMPVSFGHHPFPPRFSISMGLPRGGHRSPNHPSEFIDQSYPVRHMCPILQSPGCCSADQHCWHVGRLPDAADHLSRRPVHSSTRAALSSHKGDTVHEHH
eukprot:EG_transcript_40525